MDRNSVIGLIIIGAILIGFTIWNSPSDEELRRQQRRADSIAMVEKVRTELLKNQELNKDSIVEKQVTDTTGQSEQLKNVYGDFSTAAVGSQKFYVIENELLKLTLSAKGGRPYSVELKNYKTYDKKPVILFNGDSTEFGLNFFTKNNRSILTNNLYFVPVGTDTQIVVKETDSVKNFALRLNAGEGKYIEYVYSVRPGSYKVDFKMNFVNMQQVISNNASYLDLNWQIYALAQEKDKDSENSYTNINYRFGQEEVEELSVTEGSISENLRNKIKWIAYKQQFFSSVIIANTSFENAAITSEIVTDTSKNLKRFRSEMGVQFSNKQSHQVDLAFYFGPNHYQTLKKFDLELEELVTLGSWIIKWINRFLIIPIFNLLDNYIFNYGIIILLLTIFIKLLLFPLTYKSYLSMAKMRVLKPQIDEINERIPADKPMERQQAVMGLYKKVGVNPLGGCLPLLLQMPILIAMFRFFPSSIELRQEGFLWVTDLSSYDAVVSWSTYIPLITPYFGNHISLFNVLMTITTIITMWMNNQANATQQTFPGMKTMMYIMPVMFMFILNKFSSGLTYYYFLANVITIIQNEVFKRSIDEAKLLHQLNENKKKPVKKSNFQMKLEEAAKKRGYNTKRK